MFITRICNYNFDFDLTSPYNNLLHYCSCSFLIINHSGYTQIGVRETELQNFIIFHPDSNRLLFRCVRLLSLHLLRGHASVGSEGGAMWF